MKGAATPFPQPDKVRTWHTDVQVLRGAANHSMTPAGHAARRSSRITW
jgi:hypothetical protein